MRKTTWENPDHPIWTITKAMVMTVVLFLFLKYGYSNGFVPEKDGPTLLGLVATYIAMNQFTRQVRKRQRS